jgi:hypothetical protein
MKTIPKYEGVYSIETDGRVWSHRKQKYISPTPDGGGYLMLDFRNNGLRRTVKIHRLLAICFLGATERDLVDHKDRNIQNNSLDNLRVCTKSQNLANAKRYKNNTSGFKGVSWHKPTAGRRGFWRVRLKDFSACFQSRDEAASCYDRQARKFYGEFALTNKELSG